MVRGGRPPKAANTTTAGMSTAAASPKMELTKRNPADANSPSSSMVSQLNMGSYDVDDVNVYAHIWADLMKCYASAKTSLFPDQSAPKGMPKK